MKVLYIFPHPDDESFGPGSAMAKQARDGHDVCLLTLTRGEATKRRFDLGLSREEMGELRLAEMQDVARVYNLHQLDVLSLPDSELKHLDPRTIEKAVFDAVSSLQPDVIVTYPVHGISGFHDHLVTHAVVKRVFVELFGSIANLKRLAFHTLSEAQAARSEHFKLSPSKVDEIDCVVEVRQQDIDCAKAALDCYRTYEKTIEASGIKNLLDSRVCFEFFAESFEQPLSDLFDQLPNC
jgi:LmbE family N-acetylglucosaminyl deacetylase